MDSSMLVLRENFTLRELYGSAPRRGNILVVTSHLLILDSMKNLLEDNLYFVQATRSSEHALLASRDFLPDLIILDTILPYTSGLELCQRLKTEESTRHIPVLFVVTSEQPEDKEDSFRVGGVDYITRPFHDDELLARVEIHLTIQRLKAELEIERREKARLSQKNRQWEQSFDERVKQSTHELEEALRYERSRIQLINVSRLAVMSRMADQITQELRSPLNAILEKLRHLKSLIQEAPGATKELENLLVEADRLVKTLTELDQISKL